MSWIQLYADSKWAPWNCYSTILSCRNITGIIWHTCVISTHGGLEVRCIEVVLVLKHAAGELSKNCLTCFRMYLRKASLGHLPIIMMMKVGTQTKCNAVAAPDLTEWVLVLASSNHNLSIPTLLVAERIFVLSMVDAMVAIFSSTNVVLTVKMSLVPG